jgi:hypothetical protein
VERVKSEDLLGPRKFSELVSARARELEIYMDRSVYSLLEIARGDDYDEMLWNMLRVLEVLELRDRDVLESISNAQDNPSLIRRYFYALIIGIMSSSAGAQVSGDRQ